MVSEDLRGAWDEGIRALLNDTSCLFFAYDAEAPHHIRSVSGSITNLAGYEPDELVGTPVKTFVVAEDWERAKASSSDGTMSGDIRIRKIDGSTLWIRTNTRMTLVDGKARFVGLGIVVDSLKRREAALQGRLSTDSLTGLLCRDAFIDRVDEELRRDVSVATGIIDLDGFKQVNDTLGHPAGDRVLGILGERLQFLVNDRLTIARLGGDEFGLLMRGEWTHEELHSVGRRLSETIAEPIDLDGIEVQTRASIGFARGVIGSTSGELMRQADIAMYEAKRSTSGFVAYYDDSEEPRSRRDLAIIATLRQSLEEQLELHYQPIIDLWTGETVAVEGLARWQHPERGLLFPGDFLPAVEIGGLGERLDLWAIESAAELGSRFTHSGVPLRVSVNVTSDGLRSLRFLPRVRRLLERKVLMADQLILEVSERNAQDDLTTVRPVLEELRELGVGISLDDFGTGFSSLTRLRDLPFTEVKMDRSFVSKMNESDADREIVRATIALGRSLGLTVVAEGVETKAIADGAGALGCSFGQGEFYAAPMPASALVTRGLIRTSRATAAV